MQVRSIKENPILLILLSVIIFSFVVILLLIFRPKLFSERIVNPDTTKKNVSPTPNYLPIAIPVLQNRKYFPVPLEKVKTVSVNNNFTTQIISYSVDGYKEYSLLVIPTTPKPIGGYPVVILNHGYITPSQYNTVSSYSTEVNFFARNGYIVLKPDYRGNGNSEGKEDALQRYNYPVDVITLLASVKNILNANNSQIYIWGHSMGGEVTLEVLEILGEQPNLEKNVRAAVLWAPVTDPAKWFGPDNIKNIPEARLTPFPYAKTFEILGEPSDSSPIWKSINPLNYLLSISVPLQLNHGTADETVPYSWSVSLNSKLKDLGKQIDFISYSGANHNLSPQTLLALQNSLLFFRSH